VVTVARRGELTRAEVAADFVLLEQSVSQAAEGVPVRLTCRVLGFSPQAFYKWCKQPVSDRDWHDAHLTNELIDAHADDPEFGYRFLTDELARAGHKVGERRVWRLCRQQRIWSTTVRKGALRISGWDDPVEE
jgi:hypothetical protein